MHYEKNIIVSTDFGNANCKGMKAEHRSGANLKMPVQFKKSTTAEPTKPPDKNDYVVSE